MAKSREELALELRLSEERFRTFMNNAPFITFVKDGEGHYLYYNERMATRFGIDQDEWIGRTDNELWPEAIARDIRLNDLEVIESGKSIERLEETIDAAGELTT